MFFFKFLFFGVKYKKHNFKSLLGKILIKMVDKKSILNKINIKKKVYKENI